MACPFPQEEVMERPNMSILNRCLFIRGCSDRRSTSKDLFDLFRAMGVRMLGKHASAGGLPDFSGTFGSQCRHVLRNSIAP